MNLIILFFALSTQAPSVCEVFGDQSFWLSKKVSGICALTPHAISEAKKNDIPPTLLLSLITVESNWKQTAVSKAGACGLTQVIPKYTGTITRKYTCEQLKNPKTSITAGAKILRWWIDYHDGNVTEGLCGYNAGFRCSKDKKKRKSRLVTSHGMRYAKKVLTLEQKIKNLYNSLKMKRSQIPSSHR